MANIQNELNNIKSAIYGKDVRNSIHDAIKQCYDDASVNNNNANMEVKLARGVHNTLNDRLSESDKKQKELSSQVDNLVLGAVGDGNNAEVIQARGIHKLLNERFSANEFNIDLLNNTTSEYINLFREYDRGYYVDASNGALVVNEQVGTTKFIDLTNINNYIITNVNRNVTHQMAFYDSDVDYICGYKTDIVGEWYLAIPNDAKYCKVSFYLDDIDSFYVKGSSKLKKYIDFEVEKINIEVNGFGNDNIIDYTKSLHGGYYGAGFIADNTNDTLGTWFNREDVSQTEFINIENSTKIMMKIPKSATGIVHQWVFKDNNNKFINGGCRLGEVSNDDVIVEIEKPERAVLFSSAYVTEYPIEVYLSSNSIVERLEIIDNKLSKLKGKKIGIIGDSISTFNEYIPNGYAYFYPRGEVTSVNNTWWKKLIDNTGMELCSNCSWSGSTVSGDTSSTTNAYSGASEKRVNDLTNLNGDTPDIIIVYISINDFGKNNNIVTGSSTGNESINQDGTLNDISRAYVLLIKKLMTKYPNAKIYCTTIMAEQFASEMYESYVNGYPNINPNDNVTLPTWNNMIRSIADNMGCGLIDMAKCGINYFNLDEYTIDKLHPNIAGHELMYKQALKDII